MSVETPCSVSDSPDDWFINREGKQYPDEVFLTEDEKRRISRSVLVIQGETEERHAARVSRAINAATNERRRRALGARRRAREACLSCEIRTACLDQAITDGHQHGTWGGLFEEDIRQLQRKRNRTHTT